MPLELWSLCSEEQGCDGFSGGIQPKTFQQRGQYRFGITDEIFVANQAAWLAALLPGRLQDLEVLAEVIQPGIIAVDAVPAEVARAFFRVVGEHRRDHVAEVADQE